MRGAWMIAVVLCAGHAWGRGVVETRPGRVEVDWTEGRIRAVGAGAADLRAPGPSVARIGAERRARRDATQRLADAARELVWAEGGTVGARVDEDSAVAARLLDALARPRDVDVRWSSDGSVEVTLALPLEAVRAAVAPPALPAADPAAPTAIVVDAGAMSIAPSLGVAIVAGSERFAGPTIWVHDGAAAAADPRAGDRVTRVSARRVEEGAIEVDLDPAELARARAAGALIVIAIRKGARK